MTNVEAACSVGEPLRRPWLRYLECVAPLRSQLRRHCCRLTGNVWDGEDLLQDTLIKVFGLLGSGGMQLDNPRAYLIRAATNLWIDRVRRSCREQELLLLQAQEECVEQDVCAQLDAHSAARDLLRRLYPQEQAVLMLKDVLDYSLEETAAALNTSVGAVKSALHRGRGRATGRYRPSRD